MGEEARSKEKGLEVEETEEADEADEGVEEGGGGREYRGWKSEDVIIVVWILLLGASTHRVLCTSSGFILGTTTAPHSTPQHHTAHRQSFVTFVSPFPASVPMQFHSISFDLLFK